MSPENVKRKFHNVTQSRRKMIHTILSLNFFVDNDVKRICDSILDEIKPT